MHWIPPALVIGASLSYVVGASLAYLRYPAPYTPIHNTLSQLGNPAFNPDGAGFYRAGCVLSGILTIIFFLRLGPWRRAGSPLQNRLLTLVQSLGVLVGLALVSFAAFPDDESLPHLIVLGILANGFAALALLSLVALRRPEYPDLTVAAVLAIAAVGLMFVIPGVHWAEWLPALLSQVYAWLLAFHTACLIGHDPRVSSD